MSNGEQKRPRGRPPGRSDAELVSFKLPKAHFDYLHKISVVEKRLGDSVHDAARHILIRELDARERAEKR